MPPTPMQLLERAAGQRSDTAFSEFVFGAPVLLKPETRAALRKQLAAIAPAKRRKQLQAVLQVLQMVWDTVSADPAKYNVGAGPLEALAARVAEGEIAIETAETLACADAVLEALSPPYLVRLSGYWRGGSHLGKWRQAIAQQRIIRAAAAALPRTGEWEAVRDQLDMDWVEIVHVALIDVPDGRWLRSADQAGQRVIERAAALGDDEMRGEISHLLGTMYLDPYGGHYLSTDYESQVRRWLWRLRDELGHDQHWICPPEMAMPAPVDALGRAIGFLRDAVRLRAAAWRPMSAKALDQAIRWLRIAGGTVDPASGQAAEQAAIDALQAIDRTAEPQVWTALFSQLAGQGVTLDFAPLLELLGTPPDDFVDRIGGLATLDLIRHAASALSNPDPRRSLELFRLAAPIVSRFADSKQRALHVEMELSVLLRALGAPLPAAPDGTAIAARASALREIARTENWGRTRLAATLLRLAGASRQTAEEEAGLALLDEAVSVAPILADAHSGALELMRARLLGDTGVNGFDRGDWASAIEFYARALACFLRLRLDDNALDMLRRINDLAARPNAPSPSRHVVIGLAPLALRIEANLGDPGRDLVLAACRHAVASVGEETGDPEVLSLLWQTAKGLRFATTLISGMRLDAAVRDAEGAGLLEQIAAFPMSLRLAAPDGARALSPDVLLKPYVRSAPAQQGDDDAARLANLQQAFDRFVTDHFMTGPAVDDPPFASTAAIQASLDERTVLLCLYLGVSADRRQTVHVLAITRTAIRLGLVRWDFEAGTDLIASTIGVMRDRIQEYDGPDSPLSDGAAALLDAGLRAYFGRLPEYLDELRAEGKDHLCIVAHGPLHYVPFHAIRQGGKPLAERWIVTSLPNMGLLFGHRGRPAIPPARNHEMTSIGLSFETHNPLSLPLIARSGQEAAAVAALFGTRPILDGDATEAAVTDALQHSRCVHLSTHGRHDANAPAFQCLFVAPDARSDGIIHSYEILSLDLRGVDVLTLSACETALGRFDPGDNLRGLPASFLLAGVSTLIGTLWEADADACETFFVAFYTALRAGADRRDAFRLAQGRTRQAFPRYADWAAFHFIGAWR